MKAERRVPFLGFICRRVRRPGRRPRGPCGSALSSSPFLRAAHGNERTFLLRAVKKRRASATGGPTWAAASNDGAPGGDPDGCGKQHATILVIQAPDTKVSCP